MYKQRQAHLRSCELIDATNSTNASYVAGLSKGCLRRSWCLWTRTLGGNTWTRRCTCKCSRCVGHVGDAYGNRELGGYVQGQCVMNQSYPPTFCRLSPGAMVPSCGKSQRTCQGLIPSGEITCLSIFIAMLTLLPLNSICLAWQSFPRAMDRMRRFGELCNKARTASNMYDEYGYLVEALVDMAGVLVDSHGDITSQDWFKKVGRTWATGRAPSSSCGVSDPCSCGIVCVFYQLYNARPS